MGRVEGADISASSTIKNFEFGDIFPEGANTWVFGQANGAIAQGSGVIIDETGKFTKWNASNAAAPGKKVGVAQFAFADGEYGFVLRGPFELDRRGNPFYVLTGTGNLKANPQYTMSGQDGMVDDSSGGQVKIDGLVLVADAVGATGTLVACRAVRELTTSV